MQDKTLQQRSLHKRTEKRRGYINYLARVQTKNATTIFRQVYHQDDYIYFEDQIHLELKLNTVGQYGQRIQDQILTIANYFITLAKDNLASLNGKHLVFSKIEQGIDVLKKINQQFVDEKGRPYMNVRILHTHILEDFLKIQRLEKDPERLEVIEHPQMTEKGRTEADIIKATKEQKAKKQAVTLQILDQLPDADAKSLQNVLFICKLNPVTEERDRRIHVDFCQSVSKWWQKNQKQLEINMSPKPIGESKQARRRQDLVPKFSKGRNYYDENSNKYDIVKKNDKKGQLRKPIRQRATQEERDDKQQRRKPKYSLSKYPEPRSKKLRERSRSRSRRFIKKKDKKKKHRRSDSSESGRRSRSRSPCKKHGY